MSLSRILVWLVCGAAYPVLLAGEIKIDAWAPYNKVQEINILPDGIVKVVPAGKICGVTKNIPVEPGRIYEFTVSIRGTGKVQTAVNGSTGFAYSPPVELSEEEWKTVALSYYQDKRSMNLLIYALDESAVFEIKNVRLKSLDAPVYPETKIPAVVFEAEAYPGTNGGIVDKADASGGKAVWGGNWYRPVALPSVKTADPLFFYIRAWTTGKAKSSIYIYRDAQMIKNGEIPVPESWQWVKIGPVMSAAMGDKVSLAVSCEPTAKVFIDKIIISTTPELPAEELEKTE